jgi:superfamily II DNA or RNA helicase
MSLRDYQAGGLDQIRAHFREGLKRILLVAPTGSGKTVMFSYMIQECVKNGMKAVILVRGRKLVDQASLRLAREGVAHGVLMSGHWNFRPHLGVQVCSIDTLISRKIRPPADLLVIDEADLAVSPGFKEVLAGYPDAFIVAVTATPWVFGGLKHLAQVIVKPVSMLELMEQGHLVAFRYFAPSEPDLTGVRTSASTHDYVVDELQERMIAGALTGHIVEHWLKLAKGRPTICFAVNINHSKILLERFAESGIRAEHIDANTPDVERDRIIRRLESGSTHVVCNVGIWCRGVDIPAVSALVLARPTQSRNLYIQQCGRGTRLFAGKRDCLLLDHAGNIKRHGFPTFEPAVDLNGKISSERDSLETKICKVCFAAYRGDTCAECGTGPAEREGIAPEESNDELIELTQPVAKTEEEQYLEYLEDQRKAKGYKPGWQYHKLLDKYPRDRVKHLIPDWWVKLQQNVFAGAPFRGHGGK